MGIVFHAPDTPAAVSDREARAIRIARVLCIMGIVYVHAWTGRGGDELAQLATTGQGVFRIALMDLFGRSSVPLLSIISGFLATMSLQRRSIGRFWLSKLQSILLPMLIWNGLAILLVSGAAMRGWLIAPVPSSVDWVVNEMLALHRPNHINVQMPFLRDLLFCMLVAPVATRLSNGLLILGMALLLTFDGAISASTVMLRPTILLFFIIGILIARHRGRSMLGDRYPVVVACAFLIAVLTAIALETVAREWGAAHPRACMAAGLFLRVAGAWLFWQLSWRLVRTPLGRAIERWEPRMFLLFCSHLILIWLLAPVFMTFVGPLGAFGYPLLLAMQPLLALAFTGVIACMIVRQPTLARALSGRRAVT